MLISKQSNSSITDSPIINLAEDQLKMSRYGKVLSSFISSSDTPMTVGLQGEWGTGKTSMMYLLREQFQQMNIATSWINTWEYSMFRNSQQTTPSILKGMLVNLRENCQSEKNWTITETTNKSINKVFRFLGHIANHVITENTGIDIKDALEDQKSEKLTSEIAEVKQEINSIITELINDPKNPYKKVVFFVDDLDRIPPNDAVEVLESLKNIFDVPHCVFVLAIDYDVVVKGLESKFGKKTDENEREFRSFFDKIIQVPFSMPTGTYDMSSLLNSKLTTVGIDIPTEFINDYTEIVKNSIGFNPRSLKRFINSFSLLRSLRIADYESIPDEFESGEPDKFDDLVLFTLIGVQISFPKIFRLLTQNPEIFSWDKSFSLKIDVNLDKIKEQVEKYGENDKLDETWELIIYGVCQTDVYHKAKTFNVLELFNFLRSRFQKKEEELVDKFVSALKFASITTVDDDVSSKNAIEKRGRTTIFNEFNVKLDIIKSELLKKKGNAQSADAIIQLYKNIHDRFLRMSEIHKWEIRLLGSYIRVGNKMTDAVILNPSKNEEITIKIYSAKDRVQQIELPNGLKFDKMVSDAALLLALPGLDMNEFENYLKNLFDK